MFGMEWTPDGRIVYSSMAQGSWDLWITDLNGGPPRQLTSEPGLEARPRMLPDGTGVAFISRPAGESRLHIRAIGLDGGGNPRELEADGVLPGLLQFQAGYMYFRSLAEGGQTIARRTPLAGGPSEPVFRDPGRLPPNFQIRLVSDDGEWIVGTTLDSKMGGIKLALVSVDQAQPVRVFAFPGTMRVARRSTFAAPSPEFGFTWAPGGRNAFDVLALGGGIANVWRYPLDGRAPAPVTTFTSATDKVVNFAWSRDGRTLAVSRTIQSTDAVLITSRD
jgi:Tol biopolymer transport system component